MAIENTEEQSRLWQKTKEFGSSAWDVGGDAKGVYGAVQTAKAYKGKSFGKEKGKQVEAKEVVSDTANVSGAGSSIADATGKYVGGSISKIGAATGSQGTQVAGKAIEKTGTQVGSKLGSVASVAGLVTDIESYSSGEKFQTNDPEAAKAGEIISSAGGVLSAASATGIVGGASATAATGAAVGGTTAAATGAAAGGAAAAGGGAAVSGGAAAAATGASALGPVGWVAAGLIVGGSLLAYGARNW
jgi:hypothetical protein